MDDAAEARPVSGEIMTPSACPVTERGSQRDGGGRTVDAEFETVAMTPVVPPVAAIAAAPAGMDFLKTAPGPTAKPGGAAFWLAGLLLVLVTFWIAGGHAILQR